ncbi:hypothetical protein ACQBAR_03760 [Propionibacteriaceae bacterium Y1685]|uniref:hypothetical protein n=1 Tax=Microlunatus sp. Y1700 TaxID=3418487 RepID=UPI003B7F4B60
MAWKDWDRTNKVVVSVCAVVVVAILITFAVLALRPKEQTPPVPPGSDSTAPPAPSPTYECTTASGPDCTKDLAEKEAARDKAYADSEAVYREFEAELDKAYNKGGSGGIPDSLGRLVGPEMRPVVEDALKELRDEKVITTGSSTVHVAVDDGNDEWPDGRILLKSCVDNTSVTYRDRDSNEPLDNGVREVAHVVMTQSEDSWVVSEKVFEEEEPKAC